MEGPEDAMRLLGSLVGDERESAYARLHDFVRTDEAASSLPSILRSALQRMRDGMSSIGEPDSVFVRSFAALVVGDVLQADRSARVLGVRDFRVALANLLRFTRMEQDTRGFVAGRGWAHAYAHLADALQFAADHPLAQTKDIRSILRAVGRLVRLAPEPFQYDEDERLARVVATCAIRDPDPDVWARWLYRLVPAFTAHEDSMPRQSRNKAFLRCALLRLVWEGNAARADEVNAALRRFDVYGLDVPW